MLAGCSVGQDPTGPITPTAVTPTAVVESFEFLGGLVLKQGGLELDSACSGRGGYSDITGGAPVTIYNAAGAVIAVGALDPGVAGSRGCVFPIRIPDVPTGGGFYSWEVTHRGKITISEADARAGGHAIATLGE